MKFFPTLLDFIDMGFECFVWVMRYPISEDINFGQALVFFLFIFFILSFVFKARLDIANDTRVGYKPRHVYEPKHMSPFDRKGGK